MIHYRAAQIADGPHAGKWHYVAGGAAVGYCGRFLACPDRCAMGYRWDPAAQERVECATCSGRGVVDNPEPCLGHDTATDARLHYKQYLLDTEVRIGQGRTAQRRCEVCEEWTTGVVFIGTYRVHVLCPEHQDRDSIAAVMGPVGESWES